MSTFIMNKNGKECIGLNKYYYKKRGSKLSLIVDARGTVLEMDVLNGGKNDGNSNIFEWKSILTEII